jgi:aspartate/methionine/tyrosine aminotransferase
MAALGVDRMGALADSIADPELLRLENIDTDIRPYAPALQAAREVVDWKPANSYLPLLGNDRLRAAVAAHVSRTSGVDYDWQTTTVITSGGWNGLLNIVLATIEAGDGVLLTDPAYAGLMNRVRLVGAYPRLVPFHPTADGWRLDLDALRAVAAEPGMRAMLLMNPSLPTGAVLTAEEWAVIAELCCTNDLLLIYDAAMERILFDGRAVIHPASLPGMADRTITVGSASKDLRMIGWRVGWVVGPPEIVADAAFIGMTNTGTQVNLSAEAVIVALEAPEEDLRVAVDDWQRRRDLLLDELRGIVPVTAPHGGWTMMLDVGALGMTGAEASRRVLETGRIAATAMDNWGAADTARYLRFVFSREPCERLRGIGERVRQSLLA